MVSVLSQGAEEEQHHGMGAALGVRRALSRSWSGYPHGCLRVEEEVVVLGRPGCRSAVEGVLEAQREQREKREREAVPCVQERLAPLLGLRPVTASRSRR